MLKARSHQRSFLDTEQFVDRLIPADSFYRQFRELVWPLIRDEDFETLYCASNGRPAISPSLLAIRADATAAPVVNRYLWCGDQICQHRDGADVERAAYFDQGEGKNATSLF